MRNADGRPSYGEAVIANGCRLRVDGKLPLTAYNVGTIQGAFRSGRGHRTRKLDSQARGVQWREHERIVHRLAR